MQLKLNSLLLLKEKLAFIHTASHDCDLPVLHVFRRVRGFDHTSLIITIEADDPMRRPVALCGFF